MDDLKSNCGSWAIVQVVGEFYISKYHDTEVLIGRLNRVKCFGVKSDFHGLIFCTIPRKKFILFIIVWYFMELLICHHIVHRNQRNNDDTLLSTETSGSSSLTCYPYPDIPH